MRIVAGKFKGRRYEAKIPPGVRPTADSVRESIFNILNNYIDFDGALTADICAGTGFMGFEALSRGASHCDFIEISRKSASFISEAASYMKIPEDMFEIHNFDAIAYLGRITKAEIRYDLAFIDPPYMDNITQNISGNILSVLHKNELISTDGLVVVETSGSSSISYPEQWEKLTERIIGETKIEFFSC